MLRKKYFAVINVIFLFLLPKVAYLQNLSLRGVWVSTVKMLDYPSRKNLDSYQLQQEFDQIVDFCKKNEINAIFFQVRPAADAFFVSKYEPWSEWLTGKQGQAPSPFFDPLEYMIEKCHQNNIQFHAWINPFRAIATIEFADVLPNHISKSKPEWFFDYGKHRYFNPGIPEVREYLVKIITDIVRRYQIDGIHFDDYFYPYPERDQNGRIIDIPDYSTYIKYSKSNENIKDWRRRNINEFIQHVHDSVKKIKSNVLFGVSPTAVWRNKQDDPNGSDTRGLAGYDWLYADALLWAKNKWIDYIAPQIYTYIGHKYVDYTEVVNWWCKNVSNIPIYIGLYFEGFANNTNGSWKDSEELIRQIYLALKCNNINGFILYRYKSLTQNPNGLTDTIAKIFAKYKYPEVFAKKDTVPVEKPIFKPHYIPPEIEHISKIRTKNNLFIFWEINDNTDSIECFEIYLKSAKTFTLLAQTTNTFINLEIKDGIFSRSNEIYILTKAKNGLQSPFSKKITFRARKITPKNL